ncbi:MAG: molybdopterin-dependent oxidoreductase [Holophagaceae bacterium]|nr:molybdopterin-dependent oxidoreductase [Holophagaceae bacterium]
MLGFRPIPAMSMLSPCRRLRAPGQLLGGQPLSFYDWYCDLPSWPEVWGEQTDVQESADWYNAKYLAVMGYNLNMTRTPQSTFAAGPQRRGPRWWSSARLQPGVQVCRQWIPCTPARTARFGWP